MSHALDFLIAMATTFLAFSVMVSGATELWNRRYGKRGAFLWKGVARMVGTTDEAGKILASLRTHPAISALAEDDTDKRSASYIPGDVFAAALADVVLARNAGARLDKYGLPEAIALLPHDLPLKRLLQMLWTQAKGDATHFEQELARYFDACMDRVSGWYKRDAQARSFWLGLVLAVTFNVDAVHIAIALWQDPQLSRSVADQGAQMAAQYRAANPQADSPTDTSTPAASNSTTAATSTASLQNTLPQELPVGWPPRWYSELPINACGLQIAWHVAAALLGLLAMAASCIVGAPVWYQLLASLLPLRAAGRVPQRTQAREGPAQPMQPPSLEPASPTPASNTPPATGSGGSMNELERTVFEKAAVQEVQKTLNVAETGLLDEPTRTAIRAAQQTAGYAPTGQLTQLLLRDLGLGGRF